MKAKPFQSNNERVLPKAAMLFKEGEDWITYDEKPIVTALVNCVKELNARIEKLEKIIEKGGA